MKLRILSIFFLIALTAGNLVLGVSAQTDDQLQAEIRARADRLNQLNAELQQTENTLKQVQGQKQSLQKEVTTLDTSLKQLDLKIRQDSVATEKLGLEIGSLEGELEKTSGSIDERRASVAALMRQMQRTEDTSVIAILLSNSSLSAILDDLTQLETMREGFAEDISRLNELADTYRQKLGIVSSKKTEVVRRQEDLKNRKGIVEEQKETRATVLAETRNQEALYQEKLRKLKAEQEVMEDEIERIEKQLASKFNSGNLPTQIPGSFIWPVEVPRVTQRFGQRSSLYRGKPHNGIDLGIPIGTAILAANDGVVMAADNNDVSAFRKYQYGKYVLIKHGNNLATLYAHLSRYTVSPGQSVKRGEVIGYSGSTGYSTGPHLHFGMYWAPSIEFKSIPPAAGLVPVGVALNPQEYL